MIIDHIRHSPLICVIPFIMAALLLLTPDAARKTREKKRAGRPRQGRRGGRVKSKRSPIRWPSPPSR